MDNSFFTNQLLQIGKNLAVPPKTGPFPGHARCSECGTGNNNDWLTELFANSPIRSTQEIARSNEAAHAAHVAMVAASKKESDARKCGKCNGTGTVYYYAHHKGGECFRCGGTGRKAVA